MFAARGSAGYSKHIAHYASRNRIGIHPASVIERRGSTRGVGLHLRDACDAGTSLLVVAHDQIVTSRSLRQRGVGFPFPPLAKVETRGIIKTLLACEDADWVELAWRICLERSCGHSFWWGWLDSLPSDQDTTTLLESCSASVKALHPDLVKPWRLCQEQLLVEIGQWYEALAQVTVMPTREWFIWSVRIVLSRARALVHMSQEGTFTQSLGVAPLIDIINTSPTLFIEDFEAKLAAFGAKMGRDTDVDLLAPSYLQLQSKDIPYFHSPSSAHGKIMPLSAARQVELCNAELEVALSWEDLPPWYQETLLTEILDGEAKSKVGLSSATPAQPPLDHPVMNSLFPSYIVTLTRDTQAGAEVLVPYPSAASLHQPVINAEADRALSVWARFGLVV